MNLLADSYRNLREAEPRLRNRDAARRLGITEAELVASGLLGEVSRLALDLPGILEVLPSLGEVTVICRNEAAVHEKTGTFTRPHFHGGSALLHGGPIDLRLFLDRWAFAFALREEVRKGTRQSLQFFDSTGIAVLKIFVDGPSFAFEALVEAFAAENELPLAIEPKAAGGEPPNRLVDVGLLRDAWGAMKDTHEFHGMLRRLGLERTRALRTVGRDWALPLRPDVADALLHRAAAEALSIMCFVGNGGAIQIHTGPVRRIVEMDAWINVLDPDFNLHLDRRLVHSAFRVRKPTRDGVVTSVELFDEAGDCIALFFGERKPGAEELPAWRALVAELEAAHA